MVPAPLFNRADAFRRRLADHDWAASVLGPVEAWPMAIRTVVRLMLDAKQPMFVVWGPQLGMLYNQAYTEFLQDKHPAAIGRPVAAVWQEIWPSIAALFTRAMAGDSVYMEDMPFVMFRNGHDEQTWFTFSYSPIYDDSGIVIGVYGTATDTTARVTTERRLALQLRLGDELRDLADPYAICARTAELLRAELGASRVLLGDIAADGEHGMFHANALDGSLPPLSGSFAAGDFGEAVLEALRAGRTSVHHDIPARPGAQDGAALRRSAPAGVRAELCVPVRRNGQVSSILVVHQDRPRTWAPHEIALVQDIAERSWNAVERARTEARLQDARAQLEQLLGERTAERDRIWDIAQDILAIATMDGFFLACNPALTRTLGWTEAELRATPFATFAHPDQLEELGGVLARLGAGETVFQYEIRSRHRDGSYRWLSWTVVPQGRMLYMAGRDVSQAREQQEALRQAEEALRQAQKMEAIGQLTGGVAHDFNNMLAGIGGNLQLATLHLKAGRLDQIARYIEGAEKVVVRAATLTHRLLAFSRRQTLDPKPTDVEQLVESMLDLVTRTVGPAINVEVDFGSAMPTTWCDPNQLENALLNLAINARDAMPDGGRILVGTRDVTEPGDDGADQHFVRISIADNGNGMTPEVAARAFEPFFTTKPFGQGTGLGLSMVIGFVSQSGGRVHLDSVPGSGTTVSLDLPRYLGASLAPAAPAPLPVASMPARRATILLVDDETSLREVLAELLRDAGHDVIEAADGPAALEQLGQAQRTVDLLVTDVGLPGMNGHQLADAIRARAPAATVLFITGYAESTLGKDVLDPGMHIMVKPFDLDVFAARVTALLGAPRHGAQPAVAPRRI